MVNGNNGFPLTRTGTDRRQIIPDVLVALLCLSGALFCFKMFRDDLYRTMDRFSEPLGTITYKRQVAQRRFSDRVLWTRLSQGAPVYQDDYIRTAEFSEAAMHFVYGPDINLAENTLIQIRTENGKNIVDLSAGDISIAVGEVEPETIRILVSGQSRMELGPNTLIRASADESGAFTMQVLEGTVTANGEDLSAGEIFSTLPREPMVLPVSPRRDTYFLAENGKAAVDFVWSRHNYPGASRLDLTQDRRFHADRMETVQITQEDRFSADLTPGVYWWRVYPENTVPGGRVEKIIVLPLLRPELVSPAEGFTFYQGESDSTELRFIWKDSPRPRSIPDSGNYIFEAADNPDFTEPRLSVNVENGTSLVCSLGEGTWYWRVWENFPGLGLPASVSYFTIAPGEQPETRIREETASEARPEIEPEPEPEPERPVITEPPLLPPPRNMNPADGFTLGPEYLKSGLDFSWEEVSGAASYVFILLEEKDGRTRQIISFDTVQNSCPIADMKLLENGSFIWRVEAVRRDGDRIVSRGKPGESRFTVNVPAPGNPRVRDMGVFYGQ
jgi:hypothetical protein